MIKIVLMQPFHSRRLANRMFAGLADKPTSMAALWRRTKDDAGFELARAFAQGFSGMRKR